MGFVIIDLIGGVSKREDVGWIVMRGGVEGMCWVRIINRWRWMAIHRRLGTPSFLSVLLWASWDSYPAPSWQSQTTPSTQWENNPISKSYDEDPPIPNYTKSLYQHRISLYPQSTNCWNQIPSNWVALSITLVRVHFLGITLLLISTSTQLVCVLGMGGRYFIYM